MCHRDGGALKLLILLPPGVSVQRWGGTQHARQVLNQPHYNLNPSPTSTASSIHSARLCFSLEGLLRGSSLMDLAAFLPVALMNHLGVHLDVSVVLRSEMLCVVSLNC